MLAAHLNGFVASGRLLERSRFAIAGGNQLAHSKQLLHKLRQMAQHDTVDPGLPANGQKRQERHAADVFDSAQVDHHVFDLRLLDGADHAVAQRLDYRKVSQLFWEYFDDQDIPIQRASNGVIDCCHHTIPMPVLPSPQMSLQIVIILSGLVQHARLEHSELVDLYSGSQNVPGAARPVRALERRDADVRDKAC